MNMNKLTEKAQEAVLAAQSLAGELTHAEITPEHLLVALIEQPGGIVPSLLRKLNVDPARVGADARELLAAMPQVRGGDLRLSPRMRLVLDAAQAEAKRLQDDYVSTEHLFVAIATEAGPLPRRAAAAAAGRHEGRALRGADPGARQPARHLAEPGVHLRGARPATAAT